MIQTGTSSPDPTGWQDSARELAQAFDCAQRASMRAERMAMQETTEPFPELVCAVRAFVRASRADGVPPERVLVAMKCVTRTCTVVCVDGSRADRLQDLVLREFLGTYYDVER